MDFDGRVRNAADADVHLEADLPALTDNPKRYPEGARIAHLQTRCEITKLPSGARITTMRRVAHVAAIGVVLAFAAPPIASAEDAAAPARPNDGFGDVSVSGNVTGVLQHANGSGVEEDDRTTRANDRADIVVSLPGGRMGDVEGKLFAHFRFGQGRGVVLRPTYTSTPNTTAFEAATSPYDAYAIVAEAWYQLTAPLPHRSAAAARERLELTVGKMDPFAFFDQNAVADDETVRFLDNAFVHNPLLDSGGDTGTDKYGFAPGVRIAYVSERGKVDSWGVSVAAFGSGPGADFSGSLAGPFVIAQLETTRRFVAGLPGTYRAYVWTDGRSVDLDGAFERHGGFGISVDQQAAESVTLWARLGREFEGQVRFDRAVTLGGEIAGDSWGRGDDALGVAAGFLRTSSDYRDATADGTRVGYAASGTERIAELYYRWRVTDHFDVTPDLQWIRRPGGDASAPDIFVGGVRGRWSF